MATVKGAVRKAVISYDASGRVLKKKVWRVKKLSSAKPKKSAS